MSRSLLNISSWMFHRNLKPKYSPVNLSFSLKSFTLPPFFIQLLQQEIWEITFSLPLQVLLILPLRSLRTLQPHYQHFIQVWTTIASSFSDTLEVTHCQQLPLLSSRPHTLSIVTRSNVNHPVPPHCLGDNVQTPWHNPPGPASHDLCLTLQVNLSTFLHLMPEKYLNYLQLIPHFRTFMCALLSAWDDLT